MVAPADFLRQAGKEGVSNSSAPNPRGGTLVSQGVNVSARYIQDKNGKVVDGFHVTAMGKTAASIWFQFVEGKRAPKRWGEATADVLAAYNDKMCRKYPELRLCAENWKAQQIATLNYSSWYKTHGPKMHSPPDSDEGTVATNTSTTKGKATKGKQRRDSGAASSTHEVWKKIKLDDADLHVMNPLWQPPPAAPSDNVPDSPAIPTPPETTGIQASCRGHHPRSPSLVPRSLL
ncbi:hypothetical protein B0H10DRAFT_738192 [Mycena sp. CBHHK59/15]|nr:hypothetical protein B0H10DRAFT_738192 [Mycena sp. CBHHK59/15]